MFVLVDRLKQNYPVFREPVELRPYLAAVLVVLYEKREKVHVILIRRSYSLKNHAGEIAFPGGIYEKQDADLMDTALREIREELNLWIGESLVIGRLPVVTTLTGFEVTPFVAFVDHKPIYSPNEAEVDEVLDIPLIPLLATQVTDRGCKASKDMVHFWHMKNRIWGATAKILLHLARLKTH